MKDLIRDVAVKRAHYEAARATTEAAREAEEEASEALGLASAKMAREVERRIEAEKTEIDADGGLVEP